MTDQKETTESNEPDDDKSEDNSSIDEKIGVMVYGSIKITDIDTGEVLVHKRA